MQRHIFDPKQPQGSMSLMNLRNTLRGLFQGDLMPLRPRASLVLDDMEYPSDAAAAAEWSGTGITVTYSTTKQEGNYSIQAATDATPDRILANTQSLDIVAFGSLTLWTRCASISSAIKFYVKDSSGNISYWDVTTHGTVDTWKQDTIDLTTADSNNGTDADLSDITEYGYSALDASETYLFDTITAIVGLCVAVDASNVGSFYKQVYLSSQPLEIGAKASPAITPPAANPRIDILTINSAGTLAWVAGDEAASPAAKWASLTVGTMPICLVYCKTTMAKVVDYEDAAANPNEAYIYADLRPMFGNTETNKLKADAADATPQYLDSLIDAAMFIISAGDVLQLKDGGVEMEKLESGSASPGNSKYYGTNAAGAKGFFSFLINLVTMVTGVLPNANGGTNQSAYAQGDILYASAANVLSKLVKGTNGQFLKIGATIPAWADVTTLLNIYARNQRTSLGASNHAGGATMNINIDTTNNWHGKIAKVTVIAGAGWRYTSGAYTGHVSGTYGNITVPDAEDFTEINFYESTYGSIGANQFVKNGTFIGVLSLSNSTVYELFGETGTTAGVGIKLVVDGSGHLILRAYINTSVGNFVYPEFTLACVVVEELSAP